MNEFGEQRPAWHREHCDRRNQGLSWRKPRNAEPDICRDAGCGRKELRQMAQHLERKAEDCGGKTAHQYLRQQIGRRPLGEPDAVLADQPKDAVRVRPVVVHAEIAPRHDNGCHGDLDQDQKRNAAGVARCRNIFRCDPMRSGGRGEHACHPSENIRGAQS
jgi:hypothetical protein